MGGVGFAVGTGRCGTKFLAELLARDPDIAAHHERHAFNDTFHRFCVWYGIDADEAGFLATKRRGIEADLRRRRYSFEASAFLSLSLEPLHEAFGAKFVIMTRRPEKVVTSYLRKGWYAHAPNLGDPDKAPTMQDVAMPHHFLGRTMPRGAEFERWANLTRVGKLAWFWARLNRELLDQAQRMPASACRAQRLEALDYAQFADVLAFLGAPRNISEATFDAVRRRRPNASDAARGPHDWSAQERAEFEQEIRETAEMLDYPWRIQHLTRDPPKPRSRLQRIRDLVGG